MTYRERQEAKAERLRGWAENREAKQQGLSQAARADEATTGIPFGQPILIGHHSERRHRRAIERMDNAMRASIDNSQKASSMRSRADSIEAAADHAIYSDDHDAIERLEEKIAGLEAKRERIKTRNAEFRKEHKAELKELTAYGRDQAMPHRSYELKNLGGLISTSRKRLEQLKRQKANPALADRTITARFSSSCEDCGAELEKGSTIRYSRQNGARCHTCPTTEETS